MQPLHPSNKIELDLSRVEFSKNDIKSNIQVPGFLTSDLCYETGTHIGDGHLSMHKRKDGNRYLFAYSGDSINESDFYKLVLIPLLEKLYKKAFHIRLSTKNTIQITILSKAIVTFKLYSLELANGKKKGNIEIPKIIMDSNIEFKKHCISGLLDTDFSLVFRHGKYPKITGEIPFESKKLKNQILEILDELDIKYNCCQYKKFDDRFIQKNYSAFKIDINGKESLNKWLNEVGFRSPKHYIKLALWKRDGYCKPFLSYPDRKRLLTMPR